VITVVDEQLRREAEELSLRFTCEHCAHYDPSSGNCGNGYPTSPHRGVELERVAELRFCKEFELS
jgi:hypothetical protein